MFTIECGHIVNEVMQLNEVRGSYKVGFTCSLFSELGHINKTMTTHQKKLDKKSDSHLFSYGYQKCMFVGSLIEYLDSPKRVHYSLWVYIVKK